MKPILHATDLSPASVAALKLSHALSKASGTTLVVLHVFEIPIVVSNSAETSTLQLTGKEVHQLELVRLKKFCREHLGEPALDDVRFRVKEGAPAHMIMRVADEIDASPIIVGTRGESRVRELLMGSTAKRLLKECKRPVLVVPMDARTTAPKKVAQAVIIEEADVAAVQEGLRYCDAMGATLTVVHVASAKDDTAADRLCQLMARVKEHCGRNDLHHELVHVRESTIAGGLDKYLRNHAMDMLVMQERKHHNVLDMLFGNDMITGMAFHATVPTLVLREG